MAVISGVAYYAKTTTVDEMSGKYQVNVGQLDTATVNKLKSEGLVIKSKEGLGDYVVLKSRFKPKIVDSNKVDMKEDLVIGNGSRVNAAYTARPYDFKGNTGVSGVLDALQIVELVQYQDKAVNEFDVVETEGKTNDDSPF